MGTSVGMHTFPYLRDHKWLTSPVKNLMDISVCGESKDDPGYNFVESTASLFIFFQLYKLFFIFIAEIFLNQKNFFFFLDEEGFFSQSTQGILSQLIDTPSKLIVS